MPVREVAQDRLQSDDPPVIVHSFLRFAPMLDNDLLFRYEEGDVDYDEFVTLFQQIWDTRAYTWLQGHYGRVLHQLLEEGVINL